jgi:diguanylate cyclase
MLSYKKVIVFPLLFASLLLTAAMVWIFFAMYQLIDLSERKDYVDTQRYNIVALRNAISDAESGQRGYLITNNVTFLDAYDAGKVEAEKYFAQLSKLSSPFPEIASIVANVKKISDSKFSLMNKSIQVQLQAGAYASHLTLVKDHSKMMMYEIKLELSKADDLLYAYRLDYQQDINTKIKTAIVGGVTLVLLTYGILIFIYKRKSSLFDLVIEGQDEVGNLSYQATHDMLTSLANRRGFESYLKNTFVKSKRTHAKFAVFYLDLDEFKQVNDTYGHEMGDKILVQVAKYFSSTLREYEFLARLGGDEFALIVEGFESKHELAQLASRLIFVLDQPIRIDDKLIKLGVSIGITCHTGNEEVGDVASLMLRADKAMYQAKQSGKNQFAFLEPE